VRIALRGPGACQVEADVRTDVLVRYGEGAAAANAAWFKARFYAMARGSATECAAVVDLISARGLALALDCRHARYLLVRIVQMLTKLITRVSARASI
jgi:four helix bundle protein